MYMTAVGITALRESSVFLSGNESMSCPAPEPDTAFRWFKKAAEANPPVDPMAHYYLSKCYTEGAGVRANEAKAAHHRELYVKSQRKEDESHYQRTRHYD
jgi:TPR repeat protein